MVNGKSCEPVLSNEMLVAVPSLKRTSPAALTVIERPSTEFATSVKPVATARISAVSGWPASMMKDGLKVTEHVLLDGEQDTFAEPKLRPVLVLIKFVL